MFYDERLVASAGRNPGAGSHPSSTDRQSINGNTKQRNQIPASFLQEKRLAESKGPNHQQKSHQERSLNSEKLISNIYEHLHAFNGTMVHEEMQEIPIQVPAPHHQTNVNRVRNQSQQKKRIRAPVKVATYTSYEQPQSSHFLLSQKPSHGPPPKKVKKISNSAHQISPPKSAQRNANQNAPGKKVHHLAHQANSPQAIQRPAHQNIAQAIPPHVKPFVNFGSGSSRWTGSASLPPPPDMYMPPQKQFMQAPPAKPVASPKLINFNRGTVQRSPKPMAKTVKSRVTTTVKRKGSAMVLPISVGNLCKSNADKSYVPRPRPMNKNLHHQARLEKSPSPAYTEGYASMNDLSSLQQLVDGAASSPINHRLPDMFPPTLARDRDIGMIRDVSQSYSRPCPKSMKGKVTTSKPKSRSGPLRVNPLHQPLIAPKGSTLQQGAMIHQNSNSSGFTRIAGKKVKTHSKSISPSPRKETAHPVLLTTTEHTPLCKSASTNGATQRQHFCKCCVKPTKKVIPKLKTNRGRLEEQRAVAVEKQLSTKNSNPLPIGLLRVVEDETDDDSLILQNIFESEFPKVVLKKVQVSKAKLDNVVSLDSVGDIGKRPIELTYRQIIQDDQTVIVINAESEIDLVSENNEVVLEYVSTCAKNQEPAQNMIPPLICRVCLLSFHSFETYITHKWSHRGIRRQIARYRSQPTKNVKPPTPKKPLSYKFIRENPRPFMCETCGKNFHRRRDVTVHLRVHTGEKPYVCTLCGKGFSQSSQLKRHLDSHTGGKPFKCDQCDNRYSRKDGLKRHMVTHTGLRPYACHLCGNTFTYSSTLSEHMAQHRGDRPHKCQFCPQTFIKKIRLTEHERIHTGIKPFVCNICNARFTATRLLNSHLKNHAEVKPFNCEECGRGFTQKGALTKHMICHSSEKPWKCETCGKDFAQPQYLKNHMKVHSEFMPYKCAHCGWGFRDKTSHTRHERLHTGIRPYKCDRCDKSFNRSTHLKKHQQCHKKYALISLSKQLQEEINAEMKMLANLEKSSQNLSADGSSREKFLEISTEESLSLDNMENLPAEASSQKKILEISTKESLSLDNTGDSAVEASYVNKSSDNTSYLDNGSQNLFADAENSTKESLSAESVNNSAREVSSMDKSLDNSTQDS